MTRPEIVFVLGMHRSGTSLVAELVHAMGYEVPGTPLETDEAVNARGFWESRQVVEFDERLLTAIGATWYQVGLRCEPSQLQSAGVRESAVEMSAFLEDGFAAHGRLVIKDPRLCHLLPVWLGLIDASRVSVKIVWVHRSPASVSRSLQARDGLTEMTGTLLWLDAFVHGSQAVGRWPCLTLDFDTLLRDPSSRTGLANFVGASLTPEQWAAIVDPSLAHHPTQVRNANPVQALANACFESVVHGATLTPEFAHRAADLRAQYDLLQATFGAFIDALAASNAALVEAKRSAMRVGALHTKALDVITGQQAALAGLGKLKELTHHQRQVIQDRDIKIEQNVAYIAKCEGRIRELDAAMQAATSELQQLRALTDSTSPRSPETDGPTSGSRLIALEAALRERDADVARNAEYIDACHRRITELDSAMVEFEALRARLAEVEGALARRETDVERNADYIAACHRRIAELEAALANAVITPASTAPR